MNDTKIYFLKKDKSYEPFNTVARILKNENAFFLGIFYVLGQIMALLELR